MARRQWSAPESCAASFARSLSRTLARTGYDVVHVATGEAAIAVLHTRSFDHAALHPQRRSCSPDARSIGRFTAAAVRVDLQ